jgi:hypothetical protein
VTAAEPGSLALFGLGLLGMVSLRRAPGHDSRARAARLPVADRARA